MSDEKRATAIRASAGIALVIVLACLGFVLAASHTTPAGYRAVHRTQHYTFGAGHSRPGVSANNSGTATGSHTPQAGVLAVPAAGLIVIETAAAIVLLVLLIRWLLQRRLRGRAARVLDVADGRLLEVRLSEATEASLAELQDGPIDDAIVSCWVRMRDAAVDAGVAPGVADSPTEFVARIRSTTPVRQEPLERLAELYREARFSAHPMSEAARTDAVRALLAIRADLLRPSEVAKHA